MRPRWPASREVGCGASTPRSRPRWRSACASTSALGLDRAKRSAHNSGMKIGYARVSTDDQTLALQFDALRVAGCEVIHEDRLSGAAVNRPGLIAAFAAFQ